MRRRTSFALAVVAILVAGLVFKLFDIQVVHAGELTKQAALSRGDTQTVYAPRGDIVAADGTVLAHSVLRYNFIADPLYAVTFTRKNADGTKTDVTREEAMKELASVTGGKAKTYLDAIASALETNPKSRYALLVKGADVRTYDAVKALGIPWLAAQSYADRNYPNGAVAGNIVGYVNDEGVGVEGLEQEYEKCLAGVDGEETYQLSADGVVIPGSQQTIKPAKQGGTVVTTLDPDLTWFLNQQLAQWVPQLKAQFGQITVVDAKTGEIKAAAQYPSVDPNDVDGVPAAYRSQAMMFSSQFEPGSTFKVLTAASMVDSGYATPNSKVVAPYYFQSGQGAKLYDSEGHDPWRLTLTGILMNSSNTGISVLGRNMSEKVRYDYYKKFGIGQPTGVGFPAEATGMLTNPSTWDDQTKYASMFGQGVSATQAQMVDAYQAIANGGVRIPLTLVKGCKQADGTVTDVPKPKPVRVIKASTAKTVLNMMESIVQQGPISNQVKIPGYRISAKTGTAQEPDGKGGYLRNYYVSVMGVVPTDNPKYVVSVNIGYPTTIRSSPAAAPLFKIVMSQVIKTFHIQPSRTKPTMYKPYW